MRDGEQKGGDDPVHRARGLIPLLNDAAPRIEAERQMPADVLEALHTERMFRVMLPKTLGGDEASLKTFSEVIEALAQGDASAAWVVSQGGGCAMGASFLQADAAKRWFGKADAALAWGAGIAGKAVEVDGGYRVTGTWAFASGSRHAQRTAAAGSGSGAFSDPPSIAPSPLSTPPLPPITPGPGTWTRSASHLWAG